MKTVEPPIVVVIASALDFRRAMRLRRLPQFFELRLDLIFRAAGKLLDEAPKLRAPVILTARHPAEGGSHRLSAHARRRLLLQFLPVATLVDIELRSVAELQVVLEAARDQHVGSIISVHDLRRTPPIDRLIDLAQKAQEHRAGFLKVATRVQDAADIQTLVEFFEKMKRAIPLSIMPIGAEARPARLFFAREGSALNYTHLGTAQVEGQWSFHGLRRALGATR